MAPRALLIAVCLLAGGCSTGVLEPRPAARGFGPQSGVLAPYDDGKRQLAAGRYGLAVERFGQALASDRRSLDALNGLAIAYTRLGRFDVGQGYFERALEIDAFSVPTLNNYGRALIEQGRLRDAGPFLQLALQHAAQADLAVVAANFESMRGTQPPALVAALRETPPPPASDSRRLIRLAANRYRLETPGEPPARPEQAVVAGRPTALDTPLGQRPSGAVPASQRQARTEPDAGPPVVLAGGEDGPAIAPPQQPPEPIPAHQRQARADADAGPPVVLAGGEDRPAIAPPQPPAEAVPADRRRARTEAGDGPSVVLAGGQDGLGIALATAADLEALGLDADTLAAAPRLVVQRAAPAPRTAAESHAATLAFAPGEPT